MHMEFYLNSWGQKTSHETKNFLLFWNWYFLFSTQCHFSVCSPLLFSILTPSYILIHDLISHLFSSHVTSHILPCFLLSLFERNFCILFLHISFVLSTTLPLCFCACSPIVLITVLVCDCIIVLAAYSLCYIPYCFINLPPPPHVSSPCICLNCVDRKFQCHVTSGLIFYLSFQLNMAIYLLLFRQTQIFCKIVNDSTLSFFMLKKNCINMIFCITYI